MIPRVYSADETAFAGGELCYLTDCVSCEVTEERNGIFELEFRYPISGTAFPRIKPGCIVISSYDISGKEEPFDIYGFSADESGIATFRARHISYRLNKITIEPGSTMHGYLKNAGTTTEWNIWRYLNENDMNEHHLNKLPINISYRILPISKVPSADYDDQTLYTVDTKKTKSLRDALIGSSNSVASQGSTELRWSYSNGTIYGDMMERRGADTTAVIRVGQDLIDYRYEYDESDFSEEIIPYWVSPEGNALLLDQLLDEQGVYPDYISVPSNMQRRERFTATIIEFTDKVEGDEQPTADALWDYAREYYDAHNLKSGYESLSITYNPIWQTDEYRDKIDPAQRLKLCDTAQVWIPEIGVSKRMKVVKTVWDALRERYTKMEFGKLQRSLFDFDNSSGTQEQDGDETIIDSGDIPIPDDE